MRIITFTYTTQYYQLNQTMTHIVFVFETVNILHICIISNIPVISVIVQGSIGTSLYAETKITSLQIIEFCKPLLFSAQRARAR